jgi:hypothetical protein
MTWQLLYWPLAIVLQAWATGWLIPAIRRTPPGAEAKRQDVALHIMLAASYVLPLLLLTQLDLPGKLVAAHALVAGGARLLLFDPVLNLAAGDIVFAVGSTAKTDQTIRWASNKLGMEPEHLRFLLWLMCLIAVIILYWLKVK